MLSRHQHLFNTTLTTEETHTPIPANSSPVTESCVISQRAAQSTRPSIALPHLQSPQEIVCPYMLKLKLPSWMCVPEVVQAGVKETIRSRRGAPNGGTPLARYPQRRQTQYCTEILQLFVNNNKEACRLSHPAHWGCEGGTRYYDHDATTRAPKTSFGPNKRLLTSWRLFAVAL